MNVASSEFIAGLRVRLPVSGEACPVDGGFSAGCVAGSRTDAGLIRRQFIPPEIQLRNWSLVNTPTVSTSARSSLRRGAVYRTSPRRASTALNFSLSASSVSR